MLGSIINLPPGLIVTFDWVELGDRILRRLSKEFHSQLPVMNEKEPCCHLPNQSALLRDLPSEPQS
jgi:hypothetical protein